MSDGLRLPKGSRLLGLHITEMPDGLLELTMWVRIPGNPKEYRLNILAKTLKEALLEAGKFLDEALGLNIQLRVKMPI